MQGANPNSFPFSSGMNPQGLSSNSQGAMGSFMQNQQPIGYPMFDQGMQNNFQTPQGNLGMNQFNPMLMQQNMGHQLQGFGMPQNAMGFQMQQQLMNGGNPGMMSSLGDQMNPYGNMNSQSLLGQSLQSAQLQNPYGSADAMSMMLQGMMGSQRGSNNLGDNFNNRGGGGGGMNQRFNSNNTNNDTSLRLNTVYVSDLPQNVDHETIRDNFSKVGSIKLNSKSGMPMIWIFKDRGVPKGDALVTFDSNSSASSAISYFKENDFNGRTIDVRIATNSERPILAPPTNSNDDNDNGGDGFNNWAKNDWSNNRQRGDFRNNARPIIDKNRGPDWICVKCNNNNFSWRDSCNRCQEPKADDSDSQKQQDRGPRGFSGPRSNNRMVHKNTSGGSGGSSGGRSQDGGPMRGPKRTSSRPGPY